MDLFANAFEHAPIGMALVAPDGRWLKVNQSVCEIVGYSEEELARKTFQEITHPDDLDSDLAFVEKLMSGEISTYRMEKRYFHKKGNIVWVWLSVSVVRDESGMPVFYISQIRDITDRKKNEAALGLLLENSPDIITRIDRERRILFVNQAVDDYLGFPGKKLVGRNFVEVFHELELNPSLLENIEKSMATGEKVTFHYPSALVPGDFFLVTITPEFYGGNEPETFLTIFRNITDLTVAEMALKKRESELNSILTRMSSVIARLDREFRVVYINDAIKAETGVPASAFIGRTLAEMNLPDGIGQILQEEITTVFSGGENREIEFDRQAPEEGKHYLGRFSPEPDEKGEVSSVLMLIVNITERKKSELELKGALEQVRKLEGMLPICSYCKSVRDDQDYWRNLDEYISRHSGTQFSHSICPNCYESKVKPEIEEFKKKAKKGNAP